MRLVLISSARSKAVHTRDECRNLNRSAQDETDTGQRHASGRYKSLVNLREVGSTLGWREERHLQVKLASDASQSGWGGVILSPTSQEVSDYWTEEEMRLDISTKEALAVGHVLRAFRTLVTNARVDIIVDTQAVMFAWNNKGLEVTHGARQLEILFFITMELNILLRLWYVSTHLNPADVPSRRLSSVHVKLAPGYGAWYNSNLVDRMVIPVTSWPWTRM